MKFRSIMDHSIKYPSCFYGDSNTICIYIKWKIIKPVNNNVKWRACMLIFYEWTVSYFMELKESNKAGHGQLSESISIHGIRNQWNIIYKVAHKSPNWFCKAWTTLLYPIRSMICGSRLAIYLSHILDRQKWKQK